MMLSKRLKDCSMKELGNFRIICAPLVKYIRKTWAWKSLKPKRYEKFKRTYEDHDGDSLSEKQAKKFRGIDDETACSFSFPVKTALPQVCYDDVNQGRDPLHVLISSCVSFGLSIGEERARRKRVISQDKRSEETRKHCARVRDVLTKAFKAKTSKKQADILTAGLDRLVIDLNLSGALDALDDE